MIVGIHEESQVSSHLFVAVIVVVFDSRVLDREVHPLALTVGAWVIHLGQPVLDLVLSTDAIENVLAVPDVPHAIGALDAVAHREDGSTVLGRHAKPS